MRGSNFKDITGQKFGRLTAIERAGVNKYNYATWKCVCECGKEVVVSGNSLRNGNTKSCGCYNRQKSTERIVALNTKHGKSHTRLFCVWSSMIDRCESPKSISFPHYGAKGISICDEWRNDFEAFYEWAMSQGYDPLAKRGEYTIDRIDNNKGYSPDNCRLANYREQADNRRSTRFFEYGDKRMNLADWARYYGRSKGAFESMSDEDILRKIEAYEAYKRIHGVDTLPRRVNWR